MSNRVRNMCKFEFVVSDGGSSRGVRQFIEQVLPTYAKENSQYQFKVVHKSLRNINPRMTVHFHHGRPQTLSLENKGEKEIFAFINKHENRPVGYNPNMTRWGAPKTQTPSIQGVWQPDLNREFPFLNIKLLNTQESLDILNAENAIKVQKMHDDWAAKKDQIAIDIAERREREIKEYDAKMVIRAKEIEEEEAKRLLKIKRRLYLKLHPEEATPEERENPLL